MVTLPWFGRDLRVAGNPALIAAVARGGPVPGHHIRARAGRCRRHTPGSFVELARA
jgi:deoxyribodipyrimidine photolyase